MVKNPPSNAGDMDLTPRQGTKIPHGVGELEGPSAATKTAVCGGEQHPPHTHTKNDPLKGHGHGIPLTSRLTVRVLMEMEPHMIFPPLTGQHRLNGHEFKQPPGDSEEQGSLACFSPWGHKESDKT